MKAKALLGFLVLLVTLTSCHPAVSASPVWGWVIIPSLALYEPIHVVPLVDGQYDMGGLGSGVAWLEQTATLETTHRDLLAQGHAQLDVYDPAYLDQEAGRIVLAGHSTGAFATLDQLQPGDEIVLVDWRRAETFTVTALSRVAPSDTSWLFSTDERTLVLITCAGTESEWRLIVQAERTLR